MPWEQTRVPLGARCVSLLLAAGTVGCGAIVAVVLFCTPGPDRASDTERHAVLSRVSSMDRFLDQAMIQPMKIGDISPMVLSLSDHGKSRSAGHVLVIQHNTYREVLLAEPDAELCRNVFQGVSPISTNGPQLMTLGTWHVKPDAEACTPRPNVERTIRWRIS